VLARVVSVQFLSFQLEVGFPGVRWRVYGHIFMRGRHTEHRLAFDGIPPCAPTCARSQTNASGAVFILGYRQC
jgi:hypothetical protein